MRHLQALGLLLAATLSLIPPAASADVLVYRGSLSGVAYQRAGSTWNTIKVKAPAVFVLETGSTPGFHIVQPTGTTWGSVAVESEVVTASGMWLVTAFSGEAGTPGTGYGMVLTGGLRLTAASSLGTATARTIATSLAGAITEGDSGDSAKSYSKVSGKLDTAFTIPANQNGWTGAYTAQYVAALMNGTTPPPPPVTPPPPPPPPPPPI